MTGVLIVGSLANVGVIFTLRTVGPDELAENTVVVLGPDRRADRC